MAFVKGQSGNPAGRPRGIGQVAKLRKKIEKDVPEIIAALVKAARAGDTQAAKLLLDRVLPALRPVDAPVALPLDAGLGENGRRVLGAVGASRITPEQGAKLLQGIGALARVVETDELERRIAALEEKSGPAT